jgi:hypothetical protein
MDWPADKIEAGLKARRRTGTFPYKDLLYENVHVLRLATVDAEGYRWQSFTGQQAKLEGSGETLMGEQIDGAVSE